MTKCINTGDRRVDTVQKGTEENKAYGKYDSDFGGRNCNVGLSKAGKYELLTRCEFLGGGFVTQSGL